MGAAADGSLRRLRFLVDNDLSPLIVKALEDFEFLEIQTVGQAFGSRDIPDEQIIPWLNRTGTIWITHDRTAKRRHAPILKQHKATVLWIRGEGLSNFDHVQIVFKVLEQLVVKASKAHGAIHFRAGKKTGPTPTIEWAEDSRDQPRQHQQRRRRG